MANGAGRTRSKHRSVIYTLVDSEEDSAGHMYMYGRQEQDLLAMRHATVLPCLPPHDFEYLSLASQIRTGRY